MSNEKIEALMWRAVAVGPRVFVVTGSNKALGSDDILAAHSDGIRAARAIGFEEGKREADAKLDEYCTRIEKERNHAEAQLAMANAENKRLREAAPVDDGRRWIIRVAGDYPSEAFPGEYTTAQKDTFLAMNAMATQSQRYLARPVEPKHVHEWEYWVTGSSAYRKCKECNVEQSPEWKDAP